MLIPTLTVTLMSQFVLPDPHDVLEERIEWDVIWNRNACPAISVLETRLMHTCMIKLNLANHRRRVLTQPFWERQYESGGGGGGGGSIREFVRAPLLLHLLVM